MSSNADCGANYLSVPTGKKVDPFSFAVRQLEHLTERKMKYGHRIKGEVNTEDSEGTTGGDNALYGGVSPTLNSYYEYPCHAFMNSVTSGAEVVYSKFVLPPFPGYHKMADTYFDWITGKNSPWKRAFEMGMSFKSKEHFDRKFWYEHGFIFDRIDIIPSNVLHNFLVASRMLKEWPKRMNRWYNYLQGGVSPEMSLILASCFTPSKLSDSASSESKDQYDWPLDAVSADGDDYVRNFLHHKMDDTTFNKPYRESHSSRPVNRIWGKGLMNYNTGVLSKYGKGAYGTAGCHTKGDFKDRVLFDLYGEYGKLETVPGSFSGTQAEWKLSTDEIIAIGKKEDRRLKA